MKRLLAMLAGLSLTLAGVAVLTSAPATADPALNVTPSLQATDGHTPVVFDITTSPDATTRCELYRKGSMIDSWAPCTGTVTLDVTHLPQGKFSLRAISYVPGSWRNAWADFIVDGQAPRIRLDMAGGAFVLEDTARATWTLQNVEEVRGTQYERQVRRSTAGEGLDGWQGLPTIEVGRSSFWLARGATLCLRVRGVDAAGNVGEWSNVECRSRPLDERDFDGWSRNSSGWKQIREQNFVNKTGLVATKAGSQLTYEGALTKTLVIWGRKGPYSGKLEVKVDGRVIDTVSLEAKVAKRDVIFRKEFGATIRGRITLTVVTSGKPVTVDAIGIASQS